VYGWLEKIFLGFRSLAGFRGFGFSGFGGFCFVIDYIKF